MSTDTYQTEADRWVASLDEAEIRAEAEALEAREQELVRRQVLIQSELARVQERLQKVTALVRFKAWWSPPPETESATETEEGVSAEPAPARGRASVRALMKVMPEVESWTIPKVLAELVERGWADKGDEHAVGVSLSRMARAGELVRVAKGVYQLPEVAEAKQTADPGPAPGPPLEGML